jgi:hypothetical protein
MAAARQKEMNDSMTVVATTTFTAPGRVWEVTGGTPFHPDRGDLQIRLRG